MEASDHSIRCVRSSHHEEMRTAPLSETIMKSSIAILSALGLAACPAPGASIYSDSNDGFLEVRETLPPTGSWPVVHGETFGGWEANVGEWYNAGNPPLGLTAIVLPFQLPDFGAVANPFQSADFGVMVHTLGDATVSNIDLYAIRTSASPAIQATDWYNGAAPDPGATMIQAGFLTPASAAGFVGAPNNNTDASGDANLVAYLNTAYNGGAGAGDYVFLRMSYASDTFATGWDAYKITMREAGQEGEWPVVTYEAIPEPAAGALLALGVLGLLGFRSRRTIA